MSANSNVKLILTLWCRGWPKFLIPAIALGLRLAVIGATFHGSEKVVSWEDVAIANNLLAGKGYSIDNTWRNRMLYSFVEDEIRNPTTEGYRATTLKPPVFPFLLVLLFSCFGVGNFVPLFIFNSALEAFATLFLYLSLEKQSKPIASLAAIGAAVYPPFLFHCATAPENTSLIFFLVSLFLYQCTALGGKPNGARFFVLGITGGMMIMTNPALLVFVSGGTILIAWVVTKRAREFLHSIVVSAVAVGLVVFPWVARNYIVFHKPVIKANLGHLLLKARYTNGDGLWVPAEKILEVEVKGRSLDEVQEDQLLKSVVIPYVKNAPFKFVAEVGKNFSHLWWEPKSYRGDHSLKYVLGRLVPYLLILPLSVIAMLWNLIECGKDPIAYTRTHCIQVLAFLLILGDSLIFSIFGAWNIRYHFPTEFAMLPFFAEAVVSIFSGNSSLARLWPSLSAKPKSVYSR